VLWPRLVGEWLRPPLVVIWDRRAFRWYLNQNVALCTAGERSNAQPAWSGDCFPSIEVLRVADGTTQVLGRVDDAGAEAMNGFVTKLYNMTMVC
jgi:hypothetical protein